MNLRTLLLATAIVVATGCSGAAQELSPESPISTPAPATDDAEEEKFARLRERMVSSHIESRDIDDPRVLDAMRAVPRHEFVTAENRGRAYQDSPLPIGMGQTISQPYIVALMTELLGLDPGAKVLEVGTGSGYQAAVLAELGVDVYSVEIIPELAERTRPVLDSAGYEEVRIRTGDGYFGWEEHSPFDAIIVTAAPDHVPPPLLAQLKKTGRMVIPVGPTGGVQTLWLIENRDGEWTSINQGAVRFVPLVGGP